MDSQRTKNVQTSDAGTARQRLVTPETGLRESAFPTRPSVLQAILCSALSPC